MPRKGSTKVKTGCLTCKARKVKCDEQRPHCRRCISTGRPCSGYPAPPTGQAAYSWNDLLTLTSPSPRPALPTGIRPATDFESRAHAFFRCRVAPALSRYSAAPSVWRLLVAQISAREPAVYHAVASISALYEGLDQEDDPLLLHRQPRLRFALSQYNAALRHAAAASSCGDADIVQLACLLFVCIEALMGHKARAVQHCRHGIMLCNERGAGAGASWVYQELGPIFLRLALIPICFGVEGAELTTPMALSGDLGEGGVGAWDSFANRLVRAVMTGFTIAHATTGIGDQAKASYLEERLKLLDGLVWWRQKFAQVRATTPWETIDGDELKQHLAREMESITCYIWLVCSYPQLGQMPYDNHFDDFAAVLALSQQLLDRGMGDDTHGFILDRGLLPSLYFVATRCRRLDMRLKALRHIRLLAHGHENLWDSRQLYAVSVRTIEMEHGLTWPVQDDDHDHDDHVDHVQAPLPKAEQRVEVADVTEEKRMATDENGHLWVYIKVFFMFSRRDTPTTIMEWMKLRPLCRESPCTHCP